MISASEANKLTKEVIDRNMQLDNIEKEINEAIKYGEYHITMDGTLSNAAKNELEKLGYKIETGRQYNASYFILSW